MVSSTTVRNDWKSNKADMVRPQQHLQGCPLPAQLLKGNWRSTSSKFRLHVISLVVKGTLQGTPKSVELIAAAVARATVASRVLPDAKQELTCIIELQSDDRTSCNACYQCHNCLL
jgi:hypothetical protein